MCNTSQSMPCKPDIVPPGRHVSTVVNFDFALDRGCFNAAIDRRCIIIVIVIRHTPSSAASRCSIYAQTIAILLAPHGHRSRLAWVFHNMVKNINIHIREDQMQSKTVLLQSQ